MQNTKTSRRSLFLLFGGLLAAGYGYGPLTAAINPQKSAVNNKGQVPLVPLRTPPGKEVATLAGGCFWSMQTLLTQLKGVERVTSGYSGGTVVSPSYEAVCTGATGHAESIQITFDPKAISYADLLHIFFTTHDPTTLNRQGADSGTQYRSAIFYANAQQKSVAEKIIKDVNREKLYSGPIVTEVTAYKNFYAAEDYHQNYYTKNPKEGYCQIVIAPKVVKFRQKYLKRLKA